MCNKITLLKEKKECSFNTKPKTITTNTATTKHTTDGNTCMWQYCLEREDIINTVYTNLTASVCNLQSDTSKNLRAWVVLKN